MLKAIPKDYFDGGRGTLKLLWEDEWRGLGITQVCFLPAVGSQHTARHHVRMNVRGKLADEVVTARV
jgi:hypothetical protein